MVRWSWGGIYPDRQRQLPRRRANAATRRLAVAREELANKWYRIPARSWQSEPSQLEPIINILQIMRRTRSATAALSIFVWPASGKGNSEIHCIVFKSAKWGSKFGAFIGPSNIPSFLVKALNQAVKRFCFTEAPRYTPAAPFFLPPFINGKVPKGNNPYHHHHFAPQRA